MGRHFPRQKVGILKEEKPLVKYWDKDEQRFKFRERRKPGRKKQVINVNTDRPEG